MVLGREVFSAALLVAAGLVFCMVLLSAPPSEAQQDLNCSDFRFQEEAQAELESDPSDPNNLDNDDDGVACETLPRGGGGTPNPSPASPDDASDGTPNDTPGDRDCSDFDSRDEAQAALDADPDDPNNLDADDDGVACEELREGPSDEPTDRSTAEASVPARADTARGNRERSDKVIRSTVPNKPLPPTGGLPVYVMVTGSILAGTCLLGLGLVVRRGPRR